MPEPWFPHLAHWTERSTRIFQAWTQSEWLLPPGESPKEGCLVLPSTQSLLIWFSTNKITYFITACERKVVKESFSIIIWFSPINGYQAIRLISIPLDPISLFLPRKLELGRSPCPYCLCFSSSRAPGAYLQCSLSFLCTLRG